MVYCTAVRTASQAIPFDSCRHAIGLTVSLRGKPLHVLLDTGVDPSEIDLGRAKALALPRRTVRMVKGLARGMAARK